jgi:hypothetical protein
VATMVAGTVTVSTTAVSSTTSRIFITKNSDPRPWPKKARGRHTANNLHRFLCFY